MKPKASEEVRKFLAEIGSDGGKKSRGGGRPRRPDDQMTDAQKKRRERYERLERKVKSNGRQSKETC